MATTTSIGGPPIAMLYANEPGVRMRGTLAAFFLVGSFLSIGALAVAGEFDTESLRLTALVVPGVVVGFVARRAGARRLDAGHTRAAVLTVSVFGARLGAGQDLHLNRSPDAKVPMRRSTSGRGRAVDRLTGGEDVVTHDSWE